MFRKELSLGRAAGWEPMGVKTADPVAAYNTLSLQGCTHPVNEPQVPNLKSWSTG